MRVLLGLIWNSGSRRESVEREIEFMFEFKGMRDIDVCSLGVNVLGNFPAFDGSCSVPVFVRRSPPNTPRRWYGSHFWLPASPSLFHARSVDSRIWGLRTFYCPQFAREAMTSILGSSSLKGLKNFFVFYFLIGGKVAMIGVKWRKWIDAMQYWPWLMIWINVRTYENFLCNTGNVIR